MNQDWLILKEPPSDRTIEELSRRYKDADPTTVQCVVTLLRTADELHGVLARVFGRYRMTQARFVVLMMLYTTSSRTMCCSDIAEAVGVSRATITGLVDGLERDRLVQRVDHPEDRRRITVALTERGAALLDDLLPGHFHTLGRLMDGLNAGERNKLCRLLERVRAGISMLPKNAP